MHHVSAPPLVDTALLQAAFDDTPAALAYLSADGVVLRASQRLAEYLQIDRDSIVGRRLSDFAHADESDELRRSVVPGDGASRSVDRHFQRGDGRTVLLTQTTRAIRDANGRFLCAAAHFDDADERRAREAEQRAICVRADAARLTAERHAAALQHASDGAWSWDVQTGALHCTPQWGDAFGAAGDVLPQSIDAWHQLVHPDDRAAFRAALESIASGEQQELEVEYRLRDGGGLWRWLVTRGRVAERHPSGHPITVVGTHADVTARTRAARNLRALVRLGDRLQRLGATPSARTSALRLLADHLEAISCTLEVAGPGGIATMTAVATALRAGDPVTVGDTRRDPRTAPLHPAIFAPQGAGAVLAMPLLSGARWQSTIVVAARGPRAWGPDDLSLVRAFGNLLVLADLHRLGVSAPENVAPVGRAPFADREVERR